MCLFTAALYRSSYTVRSGAVCTLWRKQKADSTSGHMSVYYHCIVHILSGRWCCAYLVQGKQKADSTSGHMSVYYCCIIHILSDRWCCVYLEGKAESWLHFWPYVCLLLLYTVVSILYGRWCCVYLVGKAESWLHIWAQVCLIPLYSSYTVRLMVLCVPCGESRKLTPHLGTSLFNTTV